MIDNLSTQFSPSNPSSTSADNFLPLLIFTLLKSNPPHLISNIEYIQRFRNSQKLIGEHGYYLSSLQAAISFIETLDHKSLTGISKQEFETNVEQAISNLPSTPPPSPPMSSQPSSPQFNIADDTKKFFQKTSQGIGKIGKLLGEVVEEGKEWSADNLSKLSLGNNDNEHDNNYQQSQPEPHSQSRSQLDHSNNHTQLLESHFVNEFNHSLNTLIQIFPHIEPQVCELVLRAENGDLNRAVDQCLDIAQST